MQSVGSEGKKDEARLSQLGFTGSRDLLGSGILDFELRTSVLCLPSQGPELGPRQPSREGRFTLQGRRRGRVGRETAENGKPGEEQPYSHTNEIHAGAVTAVRPSSGISPKVRRHRTENQNCEKESDGHTDNPERYPG